ncbi:hypothetical protein HB816_08695 [Listeria booriae]|uniref:hypothetical protein n=1 Tax=Listeria booriae TaxID=1552123 RepID=UPI001629E99E|nr:hypothetical protein [Listeria booriae]MBC1230520.1 hypothetical protein [Listeria booriae]
MSKFTEEQLISVWRENGFAVGNDDWQDVTLVDETEWIDQGKFGSKDIVFLHNSKHYSYSLYRQGDYYRGYEFGVEDGATEVTEKRTTKTIEVVEWIPVEEAE